MMHKKTFPFPIGTVHIIGIGGIGMSGYAEVLHAMGYDVQGSDLSDSANVQRLKKLGIRVFIGCDAKNVENADVVAKSTAVRDDNAEIVAAHARHIPVIARVDLLSELMRTKWCINVSGTHGKTTTTSLIGHVLEYARLDPTVINGGIINAYGSNTRMGSSNWMVVEADESDGTFAKLPSVASVITNIDPEHMDYYGSFDAVREAYIEYARNLPFYGTAIACVDHPVVRDIIPQFRRKTVTYGFSNDAMIKGSQLRTTETGLAFQVTVESLGKTLDVRLPLFGTHNAQNALAAIAVGLQVGIDIDMILLALSKFSGVKRRFTLTGVANGISVIDDYGHHPAEISAVLKAAREAQTARKGGRVIAVMQPHRFSRLQSLFDDFSRCFADADTVVIADIYAAGETPIAGITKEALASAVRKSGKTDVHALDDPQSLPALVLQLARSGDMVVCLGAGSITHWANKLPQELQLLQQANHKERA